jgi:hypothetical protein
MNQKLSITSIIIVLGFYLSGCAAGQLFGPTITPSPLPINIPTATEIPTNTITPTPVITKHDGTWRGMGHGDKGKTQIFDNTYSLSTDFKIIIKNNFVTQVIGTAGFGVCGLYHFDIAASKLINKLENSELDGFTLIAKPIGALDAVTIANAKFIAEDRMAGQVVVTIRDGCPGHNASSLYEDFEAARISK